jgi:hypothetical protein
MTQQTGIEARIKVTGAFEFKDQDGKVVKVIDFTGSVPIDMTGAQDGLDDCERSEESRA